MIRKCKLWGKERWLDASVLFFPVIFFPFPVFLNAPSFQCNSQWITDCIPPSLRVVSRCSSGCSEGLWCKYPNALLELMSKNTQSLQTLRLKKLLMATTAIYTPAKLCNAHGTFPNTSHRSFCQQSRHYYYPYFTRGCGLSKGWSWNLNSDHNTWGSIQDTPNTQLIKIDFFPLQKQIWEEDLVDKSFICRLHYQIFQWG